MLVGIEDRARGRVVGDEVGELGIGEIRRGFEGYVIYFDFGFYFKISGKLFMGCKFWKRIDIVIIVGFLRLFKEKCGIS